MDHERNNARLHSLHTKWMELSFVASAAAIFSDFIGLLAAKYNASKAVSATVIANIAAWGTAIYAQYKAHNISMEEKGKDRQEILLAAREEAKSTVNDHLHGKKWQESIGQETATKDPGRIY